MRIGIVGQGYVGATLAKAASDSGHSVLGIEVDEKRIEELKGSPFPITSDFSELGSCEVVVIAVPTPLDRERNPDLSFLKSACESIRGSISTGTLVINESTSFPGTLRNVIASILGESFQYASAPERVDPGNEKWNLKNTPRLVAGLTDEATKRAVEFYKSICDEVIEVSSPEVTEAAKLFENTFRQVNIALVNEFAQIASSLGISTFEVLGAAATKPYGFMPFLPSVGVGGHCIPVDPSYLSYVAEKVGMDAQFINLANEVNLGMPEYVASKIDSKFGLRGKKVQVAGISYKAGVADTRESPSIALIKALRDRRADVNWSDSLVKEFAGEMSAPISKVDIGVICTAHPGVDYSPWKNGTIVVDVSTAKDLGWPKFL